MQKTALISVSNKTNLIPFVKELVELNYRIISTGGTQKVISQAGIPVIGISEITHFPEMLDGRVKTLHPAVHAGLLAVRDNATHQEEMQSQNINYIDLVVVNLYPFKETITKEDVKYDEAIENIDIGGPSMLRSAAKNHKFVTVICDPNDYQSVLNEIKEKGNTSYELRQILAAKVFRHTASYDSTIATYLTEQVQEEKPESLTISFDLKQHLRYGENPHQKALFYKGKKQGYSIAYAEQLHGKELSYNNIQDADAALQIVKEFDEPVFVAVKHKNPCGVGIGTNALEAWKRAYDADSVSIYGGIVATNQVIDEETATIMQSVFLEIILAPAFTEKAFSILSKKKNIRLMTFDLTKNTTQEHLYLSVTGGLLVQDRDTGCPKDYKLNVVTLKKPSAEELKDLIFAMLICKHVKSNAITVVKNQKSLGIGAGQMNRVGSAKIALEQAKSAGETQGLIMASDAFFPFDDVVRLAHEYGVTAIIQPGGSVRDEDSINACNEYGISMIFTGMRHFKH